MVLVSWSPVTMRVSLKDHFIMFYSYTFLIFYGILENVHVS